MLYFTDYLFPSTTLYIFIPSPSISSCTSLHSTYTELSLSDSTVSTFPTDFGSIQTECTLNGSCFHCSSTSFAIHSHSIPISYSLSLSSCSPPQIGSISVWDYEWPS